MITDSIVHSFKRELLDGVHQAGDVYMIALYTSSAALGPDTTVYSSAGESKGAGYTAGGMQLTGRSVKQSSSGAAWLEWADPVWKNARFSARGALIYNATRGNRALRVLDFGEEVTSTNAPFTVELPRGADNGLIHCR